MNSLAIKFNETAIMPVGKDRNLKRDALFKEMCDTITYDYEVDMSGTELGYVMTALAFIKTFPETSYSTKQKLLSFVCECSIGSEYAIDKARKVFAVLLGSGSSSAHSHIMYDYILAHPKISHDSVNGAFLGCATGDSLGLPVEGFSRTLCKQYVAEIVTPELIPAYHRNNFVFGQYSDDTQLSREFYLSVVQNRGKIDPTVFGLRIASLFQPNAYRIVGYGAQTARAAEAIRKGFSVTHSGCSKGQGNGSIMRSPAVGLVMTTHTKQNIIDATTVLSSITHASPAAIDGSVAVSLATKYAASTRNMPIDPVHFMEYIKEGVSESFSSYLDEVLSMFLGNMPWEMVANRIIEIGVSNGERRWGDGISIGSRQTALWAIYSFLANPNSFTDCMACAIMVGGDVDTTAATVGGIIGARVGYAGIPAIWKKQVHDMGEWKHDDLLAVSQKVFELIQNKSVSWNGEICC